MFHDISMYGLTEEDAEIVSLVAEERLRPQLVTTAVVGWEDAPAAMLDLPTKVIISRL